MAAASRLKPLAAPLLGRLSGHGGPVEEDILQPAEDEAVTPPVLLEGMLDRVTGTDEHSTLDYHLQAATETRVTHAPVVRRVWRDALVRRDGWSVWTTGERYAGIRRAVDLSSSLIDVPVLRYCHSYVSWRYFGHWLTDSIPTALLEPSDGFAWLPSDPGWSHAAPYREALGLPAPGAPIARARRLVTYQDHGQGSLKRARYETLRDRLHQRWRTDGPALSVYLRRGRTGAARLVADEDALVGALVARGWTVVDMASATVDALQSALCRADAVLSLDGSHLTHAQMSLRPGAALVVLLPHDRFTTTHVGLARAHDVSTGLVVMAGGGPDGYRVDMDEVLRTVALTVG
jgi:hypothetical protein